MPREPFEIGGCSIAPGTAANVSLPLATLPSGLSAGLNCRVLHGDADGPTIFISAAVHGDEIIGCAIIRDLLGQLEPENISGTIIFVPTVNLFGFLNRSRYLPDRRDLNRCFPGSSNGSLAGQLAHLFLSAIVKRCSLGIDIHSAAAHRYNLPQIRYDNASDHLRKLALAFAPPAIIASPLRPGSMREIAGREGVDMLLLEAGEALRFDDLSISVGVTGILRVLATLEMIDPQSAPPAAATPARSSSSQWLRAPCGGISKRLRRSGDVVEAGEPLAIIADILADRGEEIIAAPFDGIIIGHSNLPVVHQGDALFHLAKVKAFDTVAERVDAITSASLDHAENDGDIGVMADEDEVI